VDYHQASASRSDWPWLDIGIGTALFAASRAAPTITNLAAYTYLLGRSAYTAWDVAGQPLQEYREGRRSLASTVTSACTSAFGQLDDYGSSALVGSMALSSGASMSTALLMGTVARGAINRWARDGPSHERYQ
jgi:hypothetical protein